MKTIYQSANYAPDQVRQRYVKPSPFTPGEFIFCEVGDDRRFDLRQGTVDHSELPEDVRSAAEAQRGQAFGYVVWPLTRSA